MFIYQSYTYICISMCLVKFRFWWLNTTETNPIYIWYRINLLPLCFPYIPMGWFLHWKTLIHGEWWPPSALGCSTEGEQGGLQLPLRCYEFLPLLKPESFFNHVCQGDFPASHVKLGANIPIRTHLLRTVLSNSDVECNRRAKNTNS